MPGRDVSDALQQAVDGKGWSVRYLSRQLADRYGQKPESWRRSLNRWLDGDGMSRTNAARVAAVLEIPAENLYPPRRRASETERLAQLEERIARLEDSAARQQELLTRMQAALKRLRAGGRGAQA